MLRRKTYGFRPAVNSSLVQAPACSLRLMPRPRPAWPSAVSISAKRMAISVIGFWRPVSTLASLIGVFSGS